MFPWVVPRTITAAYARDFTNPIWIKLDSQPECINIQADRVDRSLLAVCCAWIVCAAVDDDGCQLSAG